MSSWEGLRKEVRSMEEQVEAKLSSLAKLVSGIEYGSVDATSIQTADQWASQLEPVLVSLADHLRQMGQEVRPGDSRAFTLARHNDIHQEYMQEFRRLKTSLQAARDKAQLLGLPRNQQSDHVALEVGGGSSAMLLRERAMLASSSSAMDHVLGQAASVASALTDQRRLFDSMNSKVLTVGSNFPLINSILGRIRRKRSKDTLVLSGVIAVCIIFTIIYIMSR